MSIATCEVCKKDFVDGRGCDSQIVRVQEQPDAFYLFIGEKSDFALPAPAIRTLPRVFRVVPAPMKEAFMPYRAADALCDACVAGYGMVGMLESAEWCKKCGGCGSVSVPGELADITCPSCRGARVELS